MIEWRRLREEQDRAYQDSLEADCAKVMADCYTFSVHFIQFLLIQDEEKKKQIERQQAEEKRQTEWQEVRVVMGIML